ncbi:hypothetical protein SUDANB95_08033 (plasmid) [Actinosynnema sp. ALI-1.44]
MTDDAPTLTLSANELWQWAQAINAITALSARFRARREQDGRLAFSEDEHAARLHEARQHPPLRQMRDAEQQEWQSRVPVALAGQQHDGPITVWTAQMVDAQGSPTGEWGLEAHTWDRGVATSSLFIVCRDAEDALAMTQHLREHGTAEHLGRLHQLAASAPGEFVEAPAPEVAPGGAPRLGGRQSAVPVLAEDAWEAALRRELPHAVAERIIVKDPAHPHHSAWRELYALANEEVGRVGADPDRLAALVARVPQWRDDVRNPPALAHWAITESRTAPTYLRIVAPTRDAPDPAAAFVPQQEAAADSQAVTANAAPSAAAEGTAPAVPRLAEVRDPRQALAWATGLDPRNPEHRVEAELGFGRWGSEVDAVLSSKFGLTEKVNAAAKQERDRRAKDETTAAVITEEPVTDIATLDKLAAEVDRLDPSKPIDRRAAHMMLGHVPADIDRLIAEKFGDDPKIAEKVQDLYPDGLPEAQAAAWRNRATGDELDEAAGLAATDDPNTVRREDVAGAADATREHGLAAAQRGVAATVAGQQDPVVRRTTQVVPGSTPRRAG